MFRWVCLVVSELYCVVPWSLPPWPYYLSGPVLPCLHCTDPAESSGGSCSYYNAIPWQKLLALILCV